AARPGVPKAEVRWSRSLWEKGLPNLEEQGLASTTDGTRRNYVEGPEEQRLRMIERTVDLGDDGRYRVAVAGDTAELDEETRAFDRALIITFGALGIGLLLTTMVQMQFGLAPVKRISAGPSAPPPRRAAPGPRRLAPAT